MRYYDTTTHTETNIKSETTIPETDERVKDFFRQLEKDEYVVYEGDLPVVKKIEKIEVVQNDTTTL